MGSDEMKALEGQIDQYGQIKANLGMIKEFQRIIEKNSKEYINTEDNKKIVMDTLKDFLPDEASKNRLMPFIFGPNGKNAPFESLNKIEAVLKDGLEKIKGEIDTEKDKVGFLDRQAIDSSMKSAAKFYSSENKLIARNAKLQSEKDPKHINKKFWMALTIFITYTIASLFFLALAAMVGPLAPLFLVSAGLSVVFAIGAGVFTAYQVYKDKKDPDRMKNINEAIKQSVLDEVEKIQDRKKGQEDTKDLNLSITSDDTNNVREQNTKDLDDNLNNKNGRKLATIAAEGEEREETERQEDGVEESGKKSPKEKWQNAIKQILEAGREVKGSHVEKVLTQQEQQTDTNLPPPPFF